MAAITRNGTLAQENQRLKTQLYQIALVADKLRGTHLAEEFQESAEPADSSPEKPVKEKDLSGKTAMRKRMDKARAAAQGVTQPR